MVWVYRTKASIIPWKQKPFSGYFWTWQLGAPLPPAWGSSPPNLGSHCLPLLGGPGPGHYIPARVGDGWAGGNLSHRLLQETAMCLPGRRIQPAGSETYFRDMSLWQMTATSDVCHLLNLHLSFSRLLALLRALTVFPYRGKINSDSNHMKKKQHRKYMGIIFLENWVCHHNMIFYKCVSCSYPTPCLLKMI